MTGTSRRLTIFEGPDGSGKTTLAKAYAEATGAVYTHLGPFPRVTTGLARLYVEAILPAVLGYTDIVMDRCWLSEKPYGQAFRDGVDRLGLRMRLLERLAWRCETMVVTCRRPWSDILACFRSRKGEEMLEREDQLHYVYNYYVNGPSLTSLPYMMINPVTEYDAVETIRRIHTARASRPHPLNRSSAGNKNARVMIVVNDGGPHFDDDPLYQWPYGSFSDGEFSIWLARMLEEGGISEASLQWTRAEELTETTVSRKDIEFIAIGSAATIKLHSMGNHHHHQIETPEDHVTRHYYDPYELITLLRMILHLGD